MKAAMVFQKRVEKLIERSKEMLIDALIIRNPPNLRYIANVRSHVDPEMTVIIDTQGEIALLTPEYEIERVKQETWIRNLIPYSYTSKPPFLIDKIEEFLRETKAYKGNIGIEKNFITARDKEELQRRLPNAKFLSISDLLSDLRVIKTAEEISMIKKAAELVDRGVESAVETLEEGITEKKISAAAEYTMTIEGSEGVPFPTLISSGKRTSVVHSYPSDKPISRGEIVLLDMGSNYRGYLGDITRVAFIGEPNVKQRRRFEIVFQALETAVNSIRPGVKASEVDKAARKVVESNGYGEYYLYPTGRGMGLEIHENPWCREGDDTELQENMILGLFPGIYIDGEGGIRIEDMILVTKDGAEFLTKYDRSLIIR
ncbi:MAG: Xaa-Pro peptidase family protein [Candidatus Jordarchaeaceae archaeon]